MKKRQQSRMNCVVVASIILLGIMQISSTFGAYNEEDVVNEEPVIAPVVVETPAPVHIDPPIPAMVIDDSEPIEVEIEEQVEEIDIPEEPSYDPVDAMCIANMLFGEISAVTYDKSYTVEEQDHIMQEWATIPLNHIQRGLADTIPNLMRLRLPSGYFVWHSRYAEEWYAEQAKAKSPDIYERCMANAIVVLTGQMQEQPPVDVIYADLKPHGPMYKSYYIDTGYYRATVYLSRA